MACSVHLRIANLCNHQQLQFGHVVVHRFVHFAKGLFTMTLCRSCSVDRGVTSCHRHAEA